MNRSAVAIILGAELRAWRNRLFKQRPGRTVLLVIFLLVAGNVFVGAAFAVGVAAAQFLAGARDALLAGAFTALSVLMLVLGFPTVIGNFFVGPDLLQLVLAPIRPVEIFAARALLAVRANVLLALVVLAFVVGVGIGRKEGRDCICVYVRDDSPKILAAVPRTLEEIPVEVIVSGPFTVR